MGVLDSLKTAAADGLKNAAVATTKAVATSSSRAMESVIAKTAAAVGSKVTDAMLKDLGSKAEPKEQPLAESKEQPQAESKQLSPAGLEAIIEARVREKGMPSNWKFSIDDLMAALNMNSSLDALKVLAVRLGYYGYYADGSAEKNAWLHAELLKALAQNEGKVPSCLL